MSYAYRDPARVTPARLAELEARDARAALLERPGRAAPPGPGQAGASLPPRPRPAARQSRITRFAKLRDGGLSIGEAAAVMHIARKTARGYETARTEGASA